MRQGRERVGAWEPAAQRVEGRRAGGEERGRRAAGGPAPSTSGSREAFIGTIREMYWERSRGATGRGAEAERQNPSKWKYRPDKEASGAGLET